MTKTDPRCYTPDTRLPRPKDETADPEDVIAACRLALIAAANDQAALAIIKNLLERAPEPREDNTGGPALLVEQIRVGNIKADVV